MLVARLWLDAHHGGEKVWSSTVRYRSSNGGRLPGPPSESLYHRYVRRIGTGEKGVGCRGKAAGRVAGCSIVVKSKWNNKRLENGARLRSAGGERLARDGLLRRTARLQQ